jgi:hypothetical protein
MKAVKENVWRGQRASLPLLEKERVGVRIRPGRKTLTLGPLPVREREGNIDE